MPDPSKHEYSAQGWPRARLTINEKELGMTAKEINEELRRGDPPIYAQQIGNQIILNPQCLQDGEEKIIVRRIKEIISKKLN